MATYFASKFIDSMFDEFKCIKRKVMYQPQVRALIQAEFPTEHTPKVPVERSLLDGNDPSSAIISHCLYMIQGIILPYRHIRPKPPILTKDDTLIVVTVDVNPDPFSLSMHRMEAATYTYVAYTPLRTW